ncbi:MAG: tRNA pseudouridine synthase A [Bacteroidota bacterium]
MSAIRLKISDTVFDKLIWLLSKFNTDEVEIINEDSEFLETQNYLDKELKEILEGQAHFLTLDDVEHQLEHTIKKHEDRL